MISEEARREQFSIGRVIGRAWGSFRTIAAAALLVVAMLSVAPEVAVAALVPANDFGSYGLLNFPLTLLTVLAQAALIWAGMEVQNGARPELSDMMSAGGKNFLGLVGIQLLSGLAILLGLVVLIIPGLYMMTVLAVSGPARIDRRDSVASAFEESMKLTKGVRWKVFALLFLTVIVVFGSLFVLGFGLSYLPADYLWVDRLIISPVSTGVVVLIFAFGTASLYHELRWGGGAAAQPIAEVFE